MKIKSFLKRALSEDFGRGDLFEEIFNIKKCVRANILAKQKGVFSGEKYAKKLCKMFGIEIVFLLKDKARFAKNDVLMAMEGDFIKLLKIERVLLNILQHSSGIATNTRAFADILDKYNCKISLLDTRKTRPNLRALEKYSVKNGGGNNHRFGLDSMLMLKDTHLAHIDSLKDFIKKAKKNLPFGIQIEIECENLASAKIAMQSGANIVMCDNMEVGAIKKVVAFRNEFFPQILLEASGNININNIVEFAKSGVDAISLGALIHQSTWIDLSMKME